MVFDESRGQPDEGMYTLAGTAEGERMTVGRRFGKDVLGRGGRGGGGNVQGSRPPGAVTMADPGEEEDDNVEDFVCGSLNGSRSPFHMTFFDDTEGESVSASEHGPVPCPVLVEPRW